MYRKILKLGLIGLVVAGLNTDASGQNMTSGRVALGIFVPRGDDADVSKTSLVLQMTGDVQLQGRLGVEAEFSWTPINLDTSTLPAGQINEARQISAVAGLRLASSEFDIADTKPSLYISARIGFSRIAVRSDAASTLSGWIGRTVDATQNLPPFSFPIRATENAFVISPRAGFLIRPSGKALVDISITPSFLFDGGVVTTQVFATIGFGLIGSLD
jgi:hypothetical protein